MLKELNADELAIFGSCSDFPGRVRISGKMGLKDSASGAEGAKAGKYPKGEVTVSKTFRDGLIYLYQRSDFKKPTWMCRVKVPGGKDYVNRSTGTGDEHKAFKFADDL